MSRDDDERALRLERQLAAAQQITHIGSWEWDVRSNSVTWSDELFRIYGYEPQSHEVTFEFFLSHVHPDDRERIQSHVRAALERGERFSYPERIYRADGSLRELDTVGDVLRDETGAVVGLVGSCRDVTDDNRARALQSAESRVLEMIATGGELEPILDAIALMIEAHAPGTLAAIMLLDASGTRIRHGSAPHLPEAYVHQIDGAEIGPDAGSCGSAAYLNQPVLVSDIENDPRWRDYRHMALPFGLRACWSTPICASDGRVLGTFALYYRDVREPGPADLDLIRRATHIAGIAIERSELDNQLRALSARTEAVREDERTVVAREIHDQLGQALTALKMDLAWVMRRASGGELSGKALAERLANMSTAADGIIEEVRRISSALRPGVLDDLGLVAAMEWQAQEFEKWSGVPCNVSAPTLGDVELDREIATNLFRIFQESLTNVSRHAQASCVDVTLERVGDRLLLELKDDGLGMPPSVANRPVSLGLLGIRERARRLGGKATIEGAPGAGTTVHVEVPLRAGGARS